MKEQQGQYQTAFFASDFRKFLSIFKTRQCQKLDDSHEYCPYYHTSSTITNSDQLNGNINNDTHILTVSHDRRRNPYGKLNRILYNAKYCEKISDGCQSQECTSCHNIWEFNYHPLIFKTVACENFYECCYKFCHKTHFNDYTVNPKTQTTVLRFSQFFRFDILTFKSIPCKKEFAHDKNSCLCYHNQKDFRRPNFDSYDHMECKKMGQSGCNDIHCPNSHNKIEQLYHPSRYKSKFCQKHENSRKNAIDPNNESTFKSRCPYGKFCSFAHDESEVSFQLIHIREKNLQFHLYAYKTVWCPITTEHNRSLCVYAHNIQDYRRNPKEYHYEPIECPFWKKNENIKSIEDAGCPEGMNCTKCHGWKEKEFHPIIYCKNKGAEATYKSKEKSDSFASSDGAKQKAESPLIHNMKESEIILKKLGTHFGNKTNLQTLVRKKMYIKNNPQKELHAPGAPFFKNVNPGKIKAQSEKGDGCKASTEEKAEQTEENGSVLSTNSNAPKNQSHLKNVEYDANECEDIDDTLIFKAFESGNERTCDQKLSCINRTEKNDSDYGKEEHINKKFMRTISKSVGCNSREHNRNFFSKEMTELFSSKIIDALRQRNISEIKLINMREQEILKIEELTSSQKTLLIQKLAIARDNIRKTPTYEGNLEKHFLKHRRQQILAKMKSKKVKQQRLLLFDSEIRELSFLSESEKRILPKIIEQFKGSREFEQLSVDIANTVSQS